VALTQLELKLLDRIRPTGDLLVGDSETG